MHKLSEYESYLHNEMLRYGLESNDENEFPFWLRFEMDTYSWIFRLSRTMCDVCFNGIVSNQLIERINNIENSRYRKIRILSPPLKCGIEKIVTALVSLNNDLQNPNMWINKNCLSKQGRMRWEQAEVIVSECRRIKPDPEWRECWEREVLTPYCTRLEAERLAISYVKEHFNIDLIENDTLRRKSDYYHFMNAKDGIFKMRFGKRESELGSSYIDIGIIKVDMLTRDVEEIEKE